MNITAVKFTGFNAIHNNKINVMPQNPQRALKSDSFQLSFKGDDKDDNCMYRLSNFLLNVEEKNGEKLFDSYDALRITSSVQTKMQAELVEDLVDIINPIDGESRYKDSPAGLCHIVKNVKTETQANLAKSLASETDNDGGFKLKSFQIAEIVKNVKTETQANLAKIMASGIDKDGLVRFPISDIATIISLV